MQGIWKKIEAVYFCLTANIAQNSDSFFVELERGTKLESDVGNILLWMHATSIHARRLKRDKICEVG